MEEIALDRLAITIVDGQQVQSLMQALKQAGFAATKVDAVGGLLQDAVVTLLVGMSQQHLPQFTSLVRRHCPSRTQYIPVGIETPMSPAYPLMLEARLGGATLFIVPVEKFVQL